jgi:putative oxidoreductase
MKQLFSFASLARFTDLWLLIFRALVGGFMLFAHGLPKWTKLMAGGDIQFANPFGIGAGPSLALTVGAEVGCSVLLILGLFSRWATIPLIITMFVAAFVANAGQPFQKMESALVYLLMYVTLFVFGPGAYSLDRIWSARLKA